MNEPEALVGAQDATGGEEADACPHCLKPRAVCVCDAFQPIDNRIELVVLQHPQEKDKLLGTGRLACLHLKRATFKVGLSWPSLSAAVGRRADPRRWAVLYLGPVKAAAPPGGVALTDGEGRSLPAGALGEIEGVIVLDGSWSKAKALWWRNPWVLKARHLVLGPTQPSLYGKLRREPRRDSLSTMEAAAFAISRIEGRPEIEKAMVSTFRRMLQRYRDSQGRPPA